MLAPTTCGFLQQGHLENGKIKTIANVTCRADAVAIIKNVATTGKKAERFSA